ncbi:transglycosylase SLT domain-containing protein [uncultured Desulfovibrio sp.]|uniref:transglycosylase SLT domain-containing protein n=1 Tax=uncultured Desulfovibrio sp. TaxID=167968 RepID=UPI00262FEB30|nr:transglycosylase SLT domain-containing protein [uncultured Desulfovibrio sp.]
MTRRITLLLATCMLLGLLGLVPLLAGFVPQYWGAEMRGLINPQVVSLRPEDRPRPIEEQGANGRVWAVRRPVDDTLVVALENLPTSRQADIVRFDADGVRLAITDRAFFYDGNAATALAPLLALDGSSMPVLYGVQPDYYGDLLDSQGRPLRWLASGAFMNGYQPVNLQELAEQHRQPAPVAPVLPLPRYDAGTLQAHAGSYKELVESFSRRYGLNAALVYAIIHSESTFRPTLVSRSSAMGLMQLLPSTASDEVHRFLYGTRGNVGFDELAVPEINIRYGTAYLHILMTKYFQDVRDPVTREYCTVAAYNMGPNRFLRLWGPTNAEAVARINSLDAADFYHKLTVELPVRETRFYVAKVQHLKTQFAGVLP